MIALYIYILLLVEAMMIVLAVVLDGFSFVVMGGKRLDVKFPFLRAETTKKRTVSRLSYIFQISNIIYVLIFVAFAIIDSFIYSNSFFLLFDFFTGATLFILSFLLSGVLGFITNIIYKEPKDSQKEDDSNLKDNQTENVIEK